MRQLNEREKNLSVFVLIVCLITAVLILKKNTDQKTQEVSEKLATAEDRMRQTQDLLKVQTPKAVVSGDNKPTMLLLKDLTSPAEAENVRVVSVDRPSETTYTLTLEGKFSDMMRFFSYLERSDGKFQVGGAQISRLDDGKNPASSPVQMVGASEPAKDIRAVLNLIRKG